MFNVGDRVKVIRSKDRSIIGSKATVKVVYDDRHFGLSIDGFCKGHRLGGILDNLSGRDMVASNLTAVRDWSTTKYTATYEGMSKEFRTRRGLGRWLEGIEENGNADIEDIRIFKTGGVEYKVNPSTLKLNRA